jgi:TPR repeat protein
LVELQALDPKTLLSLAEKGNPTAQYILSNNLAESGDTEAADKWRLTAANNGSMYAQYDMGIILLEEWSSNEDADPKLRDDAMHWFVAAAKQGDEMAIDELKAALTPEGFRKLGL